MNDSLNQTNDIYTINEIMDKFQLTRRTILKYIKEGRLKAFRLGNSYRITEKSLNDFIVKNSTK